MIRALRWGARVIVAIGCLVSPQAEAQTPDYVDASDDAVDMVDYDDGMVAGDNASEVAGEVSRSGEISIQGGGVETDASAGGRASGPPVDVSDAERARRRMWEWGAMRHHLAWSGTTGLMDVKQAGSGEAGSFSVGFFTGFFKYSDYLVLGDTNLQMQGNVGLRITPLEFLEVHARVHAFANQNDQQYPELFQMIGDTSFGVKGFFSPVDMVTLGLDAGLVFMNTVGDVAMDWSGTSFGFDGLATFDFTELTEKAPVRAHLMAGYFFDNSSNLIADIESRGGGCGSDVDGNGLVEYGGCLSPIERTALGINRNDQVRLGIGLDALLPYVTPMVEYHMEIPVNRQGFTCPQAPGYDRCMADIGASGVRQWLNIGARVLPPIPDLAMEMGVEIGLTGYAPTVHELVAQEPYLVKFGLSYAFSPFKEAPCQPELQVVEKEVVVPVAESRESGVIVAGMVHDEASKTNGIAGAVIAFKGLQLNPQVSSSTGRFNTYELPLGTVEISISADGYESSDFVLELTESGVMEQFFPLTPMPEKKGVLSVQVQDDKGKPVGNLEVSLSGADSGTHVTDDAGLLMVEVAAGTYEITVSDEAYLHKVMSTTVATDERTRVEMALTPKPKTALVEIKQTQIQIKRRIHFKAGSDEIQASSFGLLDQVADVIQRNPHITLVEIQGHTDNRGKASFNDELSDKRANSVKRYLVEAGVKADRLRTKGFGSSQPIAPNITSTGRAKNRRVEFHIIEQ